MKKFNYTISIIITYITFMAPITAGAIDIDREESVSEQLMKSAKKNKASMKLGVDLNHRTVIQ